MTSKGYEDPGSWILKRLKTDLSNSTKFVGDKQKLEERNVVPQTRVPDINNLDTDGDNQESPVQNGGQAQNISGVLAENMEISSADPREMNSEGNGSTDDAGEPCGSASTSHITRPVKDMLLSGGSSITHTTHTTHTTSQGEDMVLDVCGTDIVIDQSIADLCGADIITEHTIASDIVMEPSILTEPSDMVAEPSDTNRREEISANEPSSSGEKKAGRCIKPIGILIPQYSEIESKGTGAIYKIPKKEHVSVMLVNESTISFPNFNDEYMKGSDMHGSSTKRKRDESLTLRKKSTQLEKHTCEICHIHFVQEVFLQRHMSKHSEDKHFCVVCNKAFSSKETLQVHTEIHDNKQAGVLQVLRQQQSGVSNAQNVGQSGINNAQSVEQNRTGSLNASGINMNNETIGNMKIKEIVRDWRCGYTDREHEDKHDKRDYKCPQYSMMFHRSSSLPHNKLQCPTCNKKFKSEKAFKIHKSFHDTDAEPVKKFKCEVCDATFQHEGSLQQHMITHNPTIQEPTADSQGSPVPASGGKSDESMASPVENHYKCKKCPMSFGQLSTLRFHVNTHSDDKPFICQQCGKSFKFEKRLKSHELTHSDSIQNSVNYNCVTCGLGFNSKQQLKLHSKTHKKEEVKKKSGPKDNSYKLKQQTKKKKVPTATLR